MTVKRKGNDNPCLGDNSSPRAKRSKRATNDPGDRTLGGGDFNKFFSDLKADPEFLVNVNANQIWRSISREASEDEKTATFDLWLTYLTEEMLKFISGDRSSFEGVALKVASVGILATESTSESEELRKILSTLKDSLGLTGVSSKVTAVICNWCELWCKKELPDGEEFGFAAFDYTSKNISLSEDVKRLKRLESLITPVDDQVFRIVESPKVLKSKEGVRLMAKLISASDSVPQIHKIMKKHIPGCSKSSSKTLGDIYLKAWKTSDKRGGIEDAVQDLMNCCIFANRLCKNQVFQPILWILNVFHERKNDRQVQSLVAKLYGPILWRNLRSGNAKIRQNAAEILFDAFPVEHPEDPIDVRSKNQERQFTEMTELLTDDFPEVRKVAATGVCKVLAKYWQILSSSDVNKVIKILVRDLCFDASSIQCRVAAVEGINHILKNCPRSHVYLKQVLPKISSCLHDVNEKVRSSMLNLLIQVKNVKLIQFWDVCGVDHLLARLMEEKSPSVSYKIVRLLGKSFFPVDTDDDERIKRCIFLLNKNRSAARKFYRYCDRSHELHHWIKFMLAVLLTLKRFAKKKLQDANKTADVPALSDCTNSSLSKGRKRKLLKTRQSGRLQMVPCDSVIPKDGFRVVESSVLSANVKGSKDDLAEEIAKEMNDDSVVAGLLDVVCVIWMSRSKDIGKPVNVEFRKLLEKKSAKMLLTLFKYYRSSEVCRPLVYISSFLPHSASTMTAGYCLSKIRNFKLEDGMETFQDNDSMTTYLDAACNWKRGDDLIDTVIGWINNEIKNHKDLFSRKTSSKRRSKGVRFDEGPKESKIKEAFVVIFYLIRHPVNRATILRKHLNNLKELQETFLEFLPLISKHLSPAEVAQLDDKIIDQWSTAFDLMFRISILASSLDDRQSFFKLVDWAKENLPEHKSELKTRLKNVMINAVSMAIELNRLTSEDTEKVLSLDLQPSHPDLLLAASKLIATLVKNNDFNQTMVRIFNNVLTVSLNEESADEVNSKSIKNALLLGFEKYPQELLKPKVTEILDSLKEHLKENVNAELKGTHQSICGLISSKKSIINNLVEYLREYVERDDIYGLMSSITLSKQTLKDHRKELGKVMEIVGSRRDVLAAENSTTDISPLSDLLEDNI